MTPPKSALVVCVPGAITATPPYAYQEAGATGTM